MKNKINKTFEKKSQTMSAPIITHTGSPAAVSFVKNCPILAKNYNPPRFWGKNGHCQSLLFSLKGRFGDLKPTNGTRFYWTTTDGATASFDVFEPTKEHREFRDGEEGKREEIGKDGTNNPAPGRKNSAASPDLTACIAPGIGNRYNP